MRIDLTARLALIEASGDHIALLAYWVMVTPRSRRMLKRRSHLASQACGPAAR